MRLLFVGVALVLSACGFKPQKLFASYANIEVREVGRSLQCNSSGSEARAALLPSLAAVLEWQAARGVVLAPSELLQQAPHAVIEMGLRNTGGYGIAVSRAAVLRGELVILQATFVSPAAGAMVTQALSSPCALVQLPPGRYSTVEVQDQNGAVRATGTVAERPAP